MTMLYFLHESLLFVAAYLECKIFTFAHLRKANRPVHVERRRVEFERVGSLALLAIYYFTS